MGAKELKFPEPDWTDHWNSEFCPYFIAMENEIRERISAWIMSGFEKGPCCAFFPVFPVINGILLVFIHPSVQSLAVTPPHPGDLQENHSLDLLQPLEERLEGQAQQDTSQVRFSKDF